MTEKRFTYKHFDWLQWHIYDNGEYLVEASGNEEEEITPLVDLLNGLSGEKEQLKKEKQELKDGLQEFRKYCNYLKSILEDNEIWYE